MKEVAVTGSSVWMFATTVSDIYKKEREKKKKVTASCSNMKIHELFHRKKYTVPKLPISYSRQMLSAKPDLQISPCSPRCFLP